MQEEINPDQDGQHLLDRLILSALPLEFRHTDIARHYQEGEFTSRLDAEVEDILRGCLSAEEPGETAAILLSDDATAVLKDLNCIALIQNGQILPLLDIERVTAPMTTVQKAHLYHRAARTLLEAVAAIYEDQGWHARRQDDDNEGDGCYV